MRIFFITHTYSLQGGGGGEAFVSNYLRRLRKLGHEVFVFTTKAPEFPEEQELGITAYRAPTFGHHAFHKFQYVLLAERAARMAKQFNADIIHAQNDVFPGMIAHWVKKRTGLPVVLGVEYLSDKAVSINLKLVFLINKIFLPRLNYDVLVSWSHYVKENFLLPWGIAEDKITVIPGAIDTVSFNPTVKPLTDFSKFGKNLIVSAKPLHRTNVAGISYVIRAMKLVARKHPNWKYVIVGSGQHQDKLHQLVKELKLQKNVIFAGPMPADKIPAVYAASKIVVHSFAFKATTSIALLESMSSGKAVVATDYGEVANTVGDAALLCRAKNPKSIAAAINALIEKPKLRKEFERKARARARLYSIELIVARFLNLYRYCVLPGFVKRISLSLKKRNFSSPALGNYLSEIL